MLIHEFFERSSAKHVFVNVLIDNDECQKNRFYVVIAKTYLSVVESPQRKKVEKINVE